MARFALPFFVAASLCVVPMVAAAPPPTSQAVAELAATGKLRAAINFGNPILATRDPATGEARGTSVDLARELGSRLGVPVELVLYPLPKRRRRTALVGVGCRLRRHRSGARRRHGLHPRRTW
jgi:ABC-type amino acid transport substrate-binding protein